MSLLQTTIAANTTNTIAKDFSMNFIFTALLDGFEPPTSKSEAWGSVRLSYKSILTVYLIPICYADPNSIAVDYDHQHNNAVQCNRDIVDSLVVRVRLNR